MPVKVSPYLGMSWNESWQHTNYTMACNSAPFTNLASIQFNTWIKEPNFLNQQRNLEFFDSTNEFLVPKHDMCIRQGFTPMLYCVQGRKCRDISVIYRRQNIVYRRVSTWYFMEKYWSDDIFRDLSREITDFSRYIGDLAINWRFFPIYRIVNANQRKSNAL